MPRSQNIYPSAQLQTFLNEPRAHGSVSPFTTAVQGANARKNAEIEEYLVAWEQNWKRLEATLYVLSNRLTSFLESLQVFSGDDFWCSSDPAAGNLRFRAGDRPSRALVTALPRSTPDTSLNARNLRSRSIIWTRLPQRTDSFGQ